MALNPSLVGRTYPATQPYEVGREKISEFADAIGDPNPVYRDRAVASKLGYTDVIAPPTFPIVLTLSAAMQVALDPDSGLNLQRILHGEQSFDYVRPVQAGDLLQVVVSVDAVRVMGGNHLVSTRAEVSTVAGDPVVTVRSMLLTPVEAGSTPVEAGSTAVEAGSTPVEPCPSDGQPTG